MDKINQEIIAAKKRIDEIDELKKSLDSEYNALQDKIHLYFDSPTTDTTEAERFIINTFWQNAYKNYADGGYITNDTRMRELRFPYECELIKNIINEHCKSKKTALELGCGNGDTSKFLAQIFDEVTGVDFSNQRIEKNITENSLPNLKFKCQNAFEMDDKFDFVFASDMFMYSPDIDVKPMFKKLLNLLNMGGVLLSRDSTKIIGHEDYKSKNYVAYYRNYSFYEKGIFEPYFVKSYRDYGYNMYHLNKFFSIFGDEKRDEIKTNPMFLEDIVKNFIDPSLKTCHFFVYRKDNAT
ncbi:MAG: class I SAM-dependent methyltransferase [Campylobacter sputorum]|uniref:class I SAM-dependent methyltransferase n=1 Tax=Campylobacter sputorum TaxID=206 RepID=UPI001374717C|nr:class I SAM-dependent methyltransferase [Campylobacter sputorum]ASM39128.1 putative methyltransferase [Campylobacter sputorum bv. paraureolyticus LMG 11764]MDY6120486.1 class I SAM-dependent methyltransferase [Campylobacter sputorum]